MFCIAMLNHRGLLMIGAGEDTVQSLPPSHQRLTERIVGVTVHTTVLSVAQQQLPWWQ